MSGFHRVWLASMDFSHFQNSFLSATAHEGLGKLGLFPTECSRTKLTRPCKNGACSLLSVQEQNYYITNKTLQVVLESHKGIITDTRSPGIRCACFHSWLSNYMPIDMVKKLAGFVKS